MMKIKFSICIIILTVISIPAFLFVGSSAEKESCVICHTDMKKLIALTADSASEEASGCGADAGEG